MPSKTLTSPRRGLNETEAAIYVGVGATLFRQMVEDRRMPKPRVVNARRIYDIHLLDLAIDSLPIEGEEINDTWADFGNGHAKTSAR